MFKNQAVIREASLEETAGWDNLVTRFENHRITHTLAWIRSLENSGKGRALFLVYEKNGEIIACITGLLANLGPLRMFGSPLQGWQTVSMGPVFDESQIVTGEMITPLINFLDKQYGVHHIEILSSILDAESMKQSGFRGCLQPTYHAALFPGDEDKVLKSMKDSARRNIKRGVKLGLTARFRDDENFVDEIYDQISEVFIRGGNTVPFGKKRVLEFFMGMKAAGKLLAIEVNLPGDGKSIATGLFTVENRELLLWMWTHRTEYRWYRPTELLIWRVIQKAMQQGCVAFDFMGRGDFKANFGAQLDTSKYRWVRSRYNWLADARDIAEKCYRWQQSVRGKLTRRRMCNTPSSASAGKNSAEENSI